MQLNYFKKLFIILILSTYSCINLYSYVYEECKNKKLVWENSKTTMSIDTNSFASNFEWDARLQNAMWHWNNVKGSGFNFYYNYTTSHGLNNGSNEIFWSTSEDVGDALAVTFSRYKCYRPWYSLNWRVKRLEGDVVFNSMYGPSSGRTDRFTTSSSVYSPLAGNRISFESVALHELGHVLGLSHQNDRISIMNKYYPNCGALGYYNQWEPHADDRAGVRFLYPDETTEVDIAASVYKNDGGSSDIVTPNVYVQRGHWIDFEFTIDNLGTSRIDYDIAYYISTNNYISTSDGLLATSSGAWANSGASATYTVSLYIPTDISTGTYYLGFIVDSNHNNSESNEYNNFVAVPQEVYVY